MNIKLNLDVDDVKLIVALLKNADPTMFFSKDLRFRIIKQTDEQVYGVAKKHEVDNTNIEIVKSSPENKDKLYKKDC